MFPKATSPNINNLSYSKLYSSYAGTKRERSCAHVVQQGSNTFELLKFHDFP